MKRGLRRLFRHKLRICLFNGHLGFKAIKMPEFIHFLSFIYDRLKIRSILEGKLLRPYDLLENVLIDIEKGIRKGITSDSLAEKYTLSERHLRKLFKFAFKQSLGGYIRSRKLAASLDDLLKTDANILDIALDYDFVYEQSYINAFKREYGVTPGNLRKTGYIVKVKPPLRLFDENKFPDGLVFGPEIVMVPKFHVIGKLHRIPFSDAATLIPKVSIQFWESNHSKIDKTVNMSAYYGILRNTNLTEGYSDYLTSLQVKDLKNIPQGFCGDTFDTSLCARFRYIGKHHYYDINNEVLSGMFKKVQEFIDDEQVKYTLLYYKVQFIKIDNTVNTSAYYGILRNTNLIEGYSDYLTSLQVKDLKDIPQGFHGDTIDTSLCARFRYIGEHQYYDLNYSVLSGMYNKIIEFDNDDHAKYSLLDDKVEFIKITTLYDGKYCQFEWFAPITEKI